MQNSDDRIRTYTIRLELIDQPGELMRALEPIAEHGGNLLAIFHERGSVTPRGHIPVEVDMEATPERFETIVGALRDAGINVVQAGTERYSDELTVVLSGHVVDTDLSDTLARIQEEANATVTDLSLSMPAGSEYTSSARMRVATAAGETERTLEVVRSIAAEKEITVIEPLA